MKPPALIAALCLAACSSESQNAEREQQMILEAHGSGRDLCTAATKVADAYLHEGNSSEYGLHKAAADATCLRADLDSDYATRGDHAGGAGSAPSTITNATP